MLNGDSTFEGYKQLRNSAHGSVESENGRKTQVKAAPEKAQKDIAANEIYKTAHNFIIQRGVTIGGRLSPLEAENTNKIKFNFLKKLRQKRSSELGMYNTNNNQ